MQPPPLFPIQRCLGNFYILLAHRVKQASQVPFTLINRSPTASVALISVVMIRMTDYTIVVQTAAMVHLATLLHLNQ